MQRFQGPQQGGTLSSRPLPERMARLAICGSASGRASKMMSTTPMGLDTWGGRTCRLSAGAGGQSHAVSHQTPLPRSLKPQAVAAALQPVVCSFCAPETASLVTGDRVMRSCIFSGVELSRQNMVA